MRQEEPAILIAILFASPQQTNHYPLCLNSIVSERPVRARQEEPAKSIAILFASPLQNNHNPFCIAQTMQETSMKYDPNIHHRRSIRLKEYDYSQPGAYFITILTRHRKCLFGEIIDGTMKANDAGLLA